MAAADTLPEIHTPSLFWFDDGADMYVSSQCGMSGWIVRPAAPGHHSAAMALDVRDVNCHCSQILTVSTNDAV